MFVNLTSKERTDKAYSVFLELFLHIARSGIIARNNGGVLPVIETATAEAEAVEAVEIPVEELDSDPVVEIELTVEDTAEETAEAPADAE